MTSKHIVVNSQAKADQVAADTDMLLAMPWPPTAFIGSGSHVYQPTEHYAATIKHPTQNKWAYALCGLEDEDDGHGGKKLKLPSEAEVKELAPDWFEVSIPAVVVKSGKLNS